MSFGSARSKALALLIAARAFDLVMLDDDAPVGRASHARAVEVLAKKHKPEDDRQPLQPKRPKACRDRHTVSDGKLATNRRARSLCAGVQDSICTSTLPGTSICAADRTSAYKRGVCLGLDHGASPPWEDAARDDVADLCPSRGDVRPSIVPHQSRRMRVQNAPTLLCL